ncbi:MAG: hypothetical protein NUV46_02990 [Nanoarchaeota archaeon]|nr:hypothetical protein [Nanoarchaeota archaeon]
MKKIKLKIEEMSVDEFNNKFKGKHLDKEVLTEEDLAEIKQQFSGSDPNLTYYEKYCRVSCDTLHRHTYNCLYFPNPETGVVERLINEIERYKTKINSTIEKLKD